MSAEESIEPHLSQDEFIQILTLALDWTQIKIKIDLSFNDGEIAYTSSTSVNKHAPKGQRQKSFVFYYMLK